MGKPRAEIEVTASSSRLASGLSAARARFTDFASSIARSIRSSMSGAMSHLSNLKLPQTASRALGNFGGDMMTRGFDVMVEAGQRVRDFDRHLTRLGISAKRTPEQLAEIKKAFRETSIATGVDSGKIAEASRTYFDKTSDSTHIAEQMRTFSMVAQAADADLEDIIKTAAALQDSLDIKPGEMESVFSGLIESGDAGTVGLKEMASTLPSLLAMFQKFGVKGRQGAMEMAAMFQVGAKSFGSGEQAAIGMENMMGMLQARQAQLAAAGVKVYEVNKKGVPVMRSVHAIVNDIAKKKIDPRRYNQIFGENKTATNFLEMLLRMPQLYDDIVRATEETGGVQSRFTAMMTSDSGRIDASINRMKESLAAAFTPDRIEKFASAMESAAGAVERVADAAGRASDFWSGNWEGEIGEARNPFEGVNSLDPFDLGGRILGTHDVTNTNADMFREKWRDITGRGRTREERIREAIQAADARGDRGGQEGVRAAGQEYLARARISKEEEQRIRFKMADETMRDPARLKAAVDQMPAMVEMLKMLGDLPAKIEAATERGAAAGAAAGAGKAQPPTVKIGDNQVAKSSGRAPDHLRRPGP